MQQDGEVIMEFGPAGYLAKITAIDKEHVFFDKRNGQSGWFYQSEAKFAVGDVLHISGGAGNEQVEPLPNSTWPEEVWVGVVMLKLQDITVIDSRIGFRQVPTTTKPFYKIGNTVLVGEVKGVTQVLSQTSIRYMDRPTVDPAVIDKFLWDPDQQGQLDFEDFGGLIPVVKRARELIEIPLKNSQKFSRIGARPIKGVLFTGPPGTGKTMLARIIASQSNIAFYKISGPEIFSKWYGESEELLRKIFEAAMEKERAIIFLDEIDSVAAQRDDYSHEASKRVVAQLLTLMDGFMANVNVVVIAATNRPQDLDIALRRPGRFDWEIEFPYPNEKDRCDILRKTSGRLCIKEPLPHGLIAARTDGWSGAELAAIWSEAAILAVADERSAINEEDYYGGFERVSQYRKRIQGAVPKGDNR